MKLVPRPTSRIERRRVTDKAWQRYVQEGIGPEGVSDDIARSWNRSRIDYQVDPAMKRPARRLSDDQLMERCGRDEVLQLARPILADFAGRLALFDHVLTFFDGDGLMLSIDGRPEVVDAVSAIDFRPGTCWSEHSAGTNGPGTALAAGRPVEVFASEHFVEAWHAWSCAAAPIMEPGRDAPVGLVDITGPWEVQRRQALVAAKAIARAIEERLRAAGSVRNEVVRYAFRAAHASGDGMVAVDGHGNVVAVNDAATRRKVVTAGALPPMVREAMRRALSGPMCARDRDVRLEFADSPSLVISPVTHEGTLIGAIVRAPASPAVRSPKWRGKAPSTAPVESTPRSSTTARYGFDRILGASPKLLRAVEYARVAASNTLPVTLDGESGTGKELFAHAIHAASARQDGPFVAVNCGAIPGPLVEAELFGYEAGTFTGAQRDGSPGRFEDADGGTLFLDEVSELSGPAQTALLRVLQEKEVVRLGGCAPRRIDVRIVAATNKPLEEEIRARRFRRDIYYRLNVLAVSIPPLRDRGDDVTLLARIFVAEAEAELGRAGLTLTDGALEALRAHTWPGNIRELRNVILRAAATAPTVKLEADHLPFPVAGRRSGPASERPRAEREAVSEAEREAILDALRDCQWNFTRAADRLGISRMTIYRRAARCGIARPPAH
jgi:sigma-54 dependent transcriptional regulator, acetoin dehydrogenase operon transcriptional activator AcoR